MINSEPAIRDFDFTFLHRKDPAEAFRSFALAYLILREQSTAAMVAGLTLTGR